VSSKRAIKPPEKSRLGQNFLVDDAASRAIVDALGDVSDATVIEIGPGHGALTSLLAPRCKQLIALEIDPQLAAENRALFSSDSNVTILEADILRADIPSLIAPATTVSVIGNLPYYISSEILLKLFSAHASIGRAVLMLQREVAERIAAPPGSSDYGLLSATTQLYATVDLLFTLPPSAFSPPPEVHSSVVRLHFAPRFAELNLTGVGPGVPAVGSGMSDDAAALRFQQFLRACFQQKRKTLRNNLRASGYPAAAIEAAAAAATLDPNTRAEALDLKAMAAIYHALNSFSA
jgi:16S rRNA (adenine1518-N6/adenine1519-N6)-dimethyltransferase